MRAFIITLIILVLLAVAGFGAWFFFFRVAAPSTTTGESSSWADTYIFDDAGLSFNYPKSYTFESYPLGDDNDSWISLLLVRTKDKEEADLNGASEGPVAMTVGIFDNSSGEALDDWIKTSDHSNFNLATGPALTPVNVGGQSGVSFEHGGLFQTDTVAVAHGTSIYLFEGEWADANDSIRDDFQKLLKTVQFK